MKRGMLLRLPSPRPAVYRPVDRPARDLAFYSVNATRNDAREKSRCHPVSSTNSVRFRPLPARSAHRYASTFFVVTASRFVIVSSLEADGFHIRTPIPEPRQSGGCQIRQRMQLREGFL